jgi:hypothetical protein
MRPRLAASRQPAQRPMRELDQDLVQEVWEGMCALDPERSQAEARAFIDSQRHLVALAEQVMQEFDEEALKSGLGLLFLLTKVLEAHHEAPVSPASRERVARAYEATLAWVERWDEADPRFLARSGEFPQPHLLPFLISAFLPGGGAQEDYDAEVRGSLFVLLKTAADALAAAPDAA